MGTHVWSKWPADYKFDGKKVLNVGCGFGQYKASNVVNLDAEDICKPDVVWDLSKAPLPFEDNAFDIVIANHILEHVPNWWNCFSDFGRILKENGKVFVFVPGDGSDSVLGYRDHINTINICSFYGTFGTYRNGSNAWAEANRFCGANRLKMYSKQSIMFNKWWLNKAPAAVKEWCATHLRNVVVENGFLFRKVTEAEFQREEALATLGRSGGFGPDQSPLVSVKSAGVLGELVK